MTTVAQVERQLFCPQCGSGELNVLERVTLPLYTTGLIELPELNGLGRTVDAIEWGSWVDTVDEGGRTVGVQCRQCSWWHEDDDDPYGPLVCGAPRDA